MRRLMEPYKPDRPSVVELAAGGLLLPPSGRLEILVLHEVREDRWCFPKGHVEPGESLRAAAEREIREETGVTSVLRSEELGEVHYRFYNPAKDRNVLKVVVYFLGRTESLDLDPEAGFDEFRWATLNEARRVVEYSADRQALDFVRGQRVRPGPERRPTRRATGKKKGEGKG